MITVFYSVAGHHIPALSQEKQLLVFSSANIRYAILIHLSVLSVYVSWLKNERLRLLKKCDVVKFLCIRSAKQLTSIFKNSLQLCTFPYYLIELDSEIECISGFKRYPLFCVYGTHFMLMSYHRTFY
jgi:hypothetical protein